MTASPVHHILKSSSPSHSRPQSICGLHCSPRVPQPCFHMPVLQGHCEECHCKLASEFVAFLWAIAVPQHALNWHSNMVLDFDPSDLGNFFLHALVTLFHCSTSDIHQVGPKLLPCGLHVRSDPIYLNVEFLTQAVGLLVDNCQEIFYICLGHMVCLLHMQPGQTG